VVEWSCPYRRPIHACRRGSDRASLGGIARLSVQELCAELVIPFAIRALPAAQLREADEVFLAATAGGIMPASRLDRRILGQ
jgi:branched-chain amino acid aminotransferase